MMSIIPALFITFSSHKTLTDGFCLDGGQDAMIGICDVQGSGCASLGGIYVSPGLLGFFPLAAQG
jgi:hypothetical protein